MLIQPARTRGLLMVWSCVLLASPLAAQSPAQVAPPRQAWADGLKIWVTTADGSEQKGTLVSFSPAGVVLQTGAGRTSIPFGDLRAIETPDSLRNGMRNGAIVGSVLFGLPALAVVTSEPCRQGCRGFATAFVVIETGVGACIGALVGMGIDHAIVRRRTLYSAPGAPAVSIVPVVAPQRKGLTLSVRW